MSRPRLLDLFCGAGGAAMGYSRAGFDVVGVDINPQPNYPFEFIRGDVMDWIDPHGDGPAVIAGRGIKAVHASPPCPRYSTITPAASRDSHPDLVEPVRDALTALGLPYVIENVVGAPMLTGFILCGSMFGLQVRRHRLFESNVLIMPPTCDHKAQGQTWGVYGHGGGTTCTRPDGTNRGWKAKPTEFADLMGMPWATPKEIVLAIPPAYTEFIGTQLLASLPPVADERTEG